MRKILLFFYLMLICFKGFGQNNNDQETDVINHEVQLGESVRMLSKKYRVEPSEIYRLNKFAVNGLSEGMVLQIPVLRKEVPLVQESKTENSSSEEVAQVATEKIIEAPIVKQLQNNNGKAITSINNSSEINHVIEPNETIYGLSKKYNVSVDEIMLANQEIFKNGLKTGQVIKIPSKSVVESIDSDIPKTEPKQDTISEVIIKHKVEPKETLFGISKQYNVSVDEIKQQNEVILQNGLQKGQILTIKKNN